MSVGWELLPMLPLRCVLDHLSSEDALSALSVCSSWRSHIMIYEGRRETLKLQAHQLEKNMFLTRIFRKHTKRLHVYLECNNEELDKFMTYVLPQFFDSVNLHEVIFIGPSYIKQSTNMRSIKLKRILTESLILKHLHSLHRLAYFGCEMDTSINDNDRYTNELTQYYSRRLSFTSESISADSILSSCNASFMMCSTLQQLIVDYNQINTESLQTLSHLPKFSRLSLNIMNKRGMALQPIDWRNLNYPNGLEVAVNIIGLPYKKLDLVMENVLVEGLNLVSLKVLFCKTLYAPLLAHITSLHKTTLKELVWSDAPHDSDSRYRVVRDMSTQFASCNVNPFMLLCWQCDQLQRLAIHGYWIWQYDVLGFVRLSKLLRRLEISSIYGSQEGYEADVAVRVLARDEPKLPTHTFVQQVNEFTSFKWTPIKFSDLHPALKARSTPAQRGEYIVQECALGVT